MGTIKDFTKGLLTKVPVIKYIPFVIKWGTLNISGLTTIVNKSINKELIKSLYVCINKKPLYRGANTVIHTLRDKLLVILCPIVQCVGKWTSENRGQC